MKVKIRKEWGERERQRGEGWSLIAGWETLWIYDVTEIVQRLSDCNKPKINYCYCITWHLSAPGEKYIEIWIESIVLKIYLS